MPRCKFCREDIPEDSFAIETFPEGDPVCEPCQENQYRVAPCEDVREARVLRGNCPDCGAKGRFGGSYECGGHCLTCRAPYSRPKPSACTGPHDLMRDLEQIGFVIASTPQVYE